MCEYQGRPLCALMASKVCYKVQVVVHNPQGAFEGVQDSLTLVLPLGMVSALRVVHCRLQMISMEGLRWMS